jgi:hypothetical protein
MDQNKLNNAIAMLQAFKQELPRATDIKESYVTLYHQTLTDKSLDASGGSVVRIIFGPAMVA